MHGLRSARPSLVNRVPARTPPPSQRLASGLGTVAPAALPTPPSAGTGSAAPVAPASGTVIMRSRAGVALVSGMAAATSLPSGFGLPQAKSDKLRTLT